MWSTHTRYARRDIYGPLNRLRCKPSTNWTAFLFVFFQAEDGIRDLVRSRGLGDVYKRQVLKVTVGEFTALNSIEYKRSLCSVDHAKQEIRSQGFEIGLGLHSELFPTDKTPKVLTLCI